MIRITLKGVPPSLNRFAGRENMNEYRNAKKQWTDAVIWTVKARKDRPSTPYRQAHVELMYYFPDNRRRDPDNYSGKLLMDGLTKAGVIADDSFACVALSIGGDCDRANPRTVITVRELV